MLTLGMLTFDLTSLATDWLQVRKVGNPVYFILFILESDTFIVVSCAKILDALGSV